MTTFADILGGPRTLTVQGLTFSYRPDAITPNSLRAILMAAEGDDAIDSIGAYQETIPMFLDSWDLEDGGEPIPVDAEGVGSVPLAILDLVFGAIMDDRAERASEEGNASSGSGARSPQNVQPRAPRRGPGMGALHRRCPFLSLPAVGAPRPSADLRRLG